jgi:hypothetical protein
LKSLGRIRAHCAPKWIVLPPTALNMTGAISEAEFSQG